MSTLKTETARAESAPQSTRSQRRRAIAASTIGTTLEFYDFVLYATLSGTVFPALFFSGVSPELGLFLSYVTLGIGYLARPLGGVIFGHFGDRVGRRTMLMITLIIMGTASVLIGLLPSAAVIGPVAAVILVLLRLFQGIAVGGEWAGAALLAMESAPVKRRGLAASAVLAGGPLGAVLAVPGQHVVDSRVGRRPPRLVVSNVTEVEAFSWSTVMRGSLSRAG